MRVSWIAVQHIARVRKSTIANNLRDYIAVIMCQIENLSLMIISDRDCDGYDCSEAERKDNSHAGSYMV